MKTGVIKKVGICALALFLSVSADLSVFAEQISVLDEVKSTLTNEGSVSIPTSVIQEAEAANTGYIFAGDSRLIGMDLITGFSGESNIWKVGEVAKGYNYLSKSATSQIDSIKASNPQISDWVEVYTFGINDPANMDKYAEFYRERGMNNKVVLVSLNPIEHHSSITNEQVFNFNQKLIMTGLPYIDTYNYLMNNGFSTTDGVHYSKDTYKMIYSIINVTLNSLYKG